MKHNIDCLIWLLKWSIILGEIQGQSWQNFLVISNTYPNHGHRSDFLCFPLMNYILMSLRMITQVFMSNYNGNLPSFILQLQHLAIVYVLPEHFCKRKYALFSISFLSQKLKSWSWSWSTEMLQPYKPSRSLRSSSKRLLTIPPAKLKKHGYRSFSSAAPTIWNSLPEPIRNYNHDDISKFKTYMKVSLFKEHFN